MKFLRLLLVIFFLSTAAFGQKFGTPLLRYYSPAEYKGFAQNWCMAQDERGVMYFGNGKGILEYNGKTWRRFPTDQVTTVLCMTKGKDGRIYIGAENEIGYLAPDSTGLMQFVSLNKFISEKESKFTYVWAVHATNEGICFVTSEKIICWNGKSMTYYSPQKGFFTSFCVNNTLYVLSTGVGLMSLQNGKLEFVKGTEALDQVSVRYIGPMTDGGLFIAGRKGCFSYKDGLLSQITDPKDETFKLIYKGTTLPDGNYALGTMNGILYIVNKKAKILETIDESKGLQGKSVYALFVDREKELWLAQENGLSRVCYTSPIRIMDERHGLHGIIRTILKNDLGFFAATFQGLYKLDEKGNFSVYGNINNGANITMPFQHKSILLSTGEIGTVEIREGKQTQMNPDSYVLSMLVPKEDSNVVIAGSIAKAYVLRKTGNSWSTILTIDSLEDEINSMAQVKDRIWLPTTNKGYIFSLRFTDNTFTKYKIQRYDSLKGIPTNLLEAYAYNDTLYIGCLKGVLYYDERQDRFLPANSHWKANTLTPPSYAYLLKVDQSNNYWALTNNGFGYWNRDTFNNAPFRRVGFTDYYAIHTEADGSAWLGGTNGIALYTPNQVKSYVTPFNALITRVVHVNDTLFNGTYFNADKISALEQNEIYKFNFPYRSNSILFEYASPFFDSEEKLSFSYRLEGYDTSWSAWIKETRKEYTNLNEGTYVFCVKAQNVYGVESSVARYEFTVLAPWYRTWWAYLSYVLGSILLIWAIIKIQTARLKKENEKLEKIVQERTEKLQIAYNEIEEKQKEILDSIHYAKRIQRSLLPTEKYLIRALGKLKDRK